MRGIVVVGSDEDGREEGVRLMARVDERRDHLTKKKYVGEVRLVPETVL